MQPIDWASTREAVVDAWLRTARAAYESAVAFAKTATTLDVLEAPGDLIRACRRAALTRIGHAHRAIELASAYSGRQLTPGPMLELLAQKRTVVDVRGLAAQMIDDCLGEGVAVEMALDGFGNATDRDVRDTLAMIARDEEAHHEIAWRILFWCCSVGDDDVRDVVRSKLAELPFTICPLAVDERTARELRRHGQVEAEKQRAIYAEVRRDVVARATRILDSLDKRAA